MSTISKRLQFNRRSMRLRNYDYSNPGHYFVTLCTNKRYRFFGYIYRKRLFLNSPGRMIGDIWLSLSGRFPDIRMDEFIVMPNHFHGIIEIHHRAQTNPANPGNLQGRILHSPDYDHGRLRDHYNRTPYHPDGTQSGSLGRVIQAFSSLTTNAYINGVKDKNWRSFNRRLWQRNYHDHIIRSRKELNIIRQYIRKNPETW